MINLELIRVIDVTKQYKNGVTAIYDLNKAEYDELLANQPSNEPLQPGEVGTMTEYVTLLDLYESALEQIQLFVILTNPEGTMFPIEFSCSVTPWQNYTEKEVSVELKQVFPDGLLQIHPCWLMLEDLHENVLY